MIRWGNSRLLITSAGLMLFSLGVFFLLGTGCAKQVIQIDGGTEATAPANHSLEHTVAPGETLRRIADNYFGNPDLASMIAARNGITDPDRIVPGSVLVLEFDEHQWQGASRRSVALQAYNKGVDLMAQDRLVESEKQFKLALKTAPDLQSASYNLALVLSRRGKNSEALVLLEELTAQRPEDTDFHFAQGHCLFQLTRFSEAAAQFEAVLALENTHKRAAFGLARSRQEGGQKDKAILAWRNYLELDSSSNWATVAQRNLRKLRDGS